MWMFISTFFHNLPKLEAIQITTTWWIYKQTLKRRYNGIETKELVIENMDIRAHYAKWKKLELQSYLLCNST